MDRKDIRTMATVVARAIFRSATGDDSDETWAALPYEEEAEFTRIAHAAISAHHAFLVEMGFKVIPKNAVTVPLCEEEAAAMIMAVKKYREGERLIKPKLIVSQRALH